ncbi:MAG: type I 3-dehydroquinate dehydratase [Verrucomicrobiales bacterium]
MPLPNLSTGNPLVVASVNAPEDIASARDPEVPADIIEWRLDGLFSLAEQELHDAVATCPRPVLLTARRQDEGGFRAWPSENARLLAVATIADLAQWVDVEARTLEESEAWRTAAGQWRSAGLGLVVSAHDFAGVPSAPALEKIAAIAEQNDADVLKIAATPGSLDEVSALGRVFFLPGPSLRSVMAMGRFGLASRLLFAATGSVLNYGYLRAASVPGQWPASELRRWIQASS